MTLTINNARNVKDLNSHKLEFVAENPYDVTVHTVSVNADGGLFFCSIILKIMFIYVYLKTEY